jgi:uncharacterized membrane protein
MNSLLKKNWITFIGIFFVFLAFLYFLKLAVDSGWLPPVARAALGLVFGLSGLFAGYTFFMKRKNIPSEILAGLGIGLMYATFAYAGFSPEIGWSTNTLMISMITLSGLAMLTSYKLNMRLLISLSLFGGFLTPIIIRAEAHQDFMLFLYMFVLNIAALYMSATKKWYELRIMAFIATIVTYTTYYVYFSPENWARPVFYVSSLFLVYMVGLIAASWYEKDKFEGLNLYLGLINAIHYVFWSIFIFKSFTIPYAIPTVMVGVIFLFAGGLIYKYSKESLLPAGIYSLLGLVVIAIAGGDMEKLFNNSMHYVIHTSVWLGITVVIFLIGTHVAKDFIRYAAVALWGILFVYWYAVAWNVEWVEWFGVRYIPFINPGALVWMAMAAIGFIFSRSVTHDEKISVALAIFSHIVIGGLFTIQIQNVWEAYTVAFIKLHLMLSIMWMLYALVIFVWGALSKGKVFRYLGSVVMIVTAIKILTFDLRGEATIYKVIFLLIIGLIILGIAYVNKNWISKEEKEDNLNLDSLDLTDEKI